MSKVKDGIIGHAIGDAMGVPIEFCNREKLLKKPVTKMLGNGIHQVPKGYWSDDTSLEIALIDSIINKKDIDYEDIMNNFTDWLNKGKYTPGGSMFGIGATCLQAIKKYEIDKEKPLECGIDKIDANGNGSLMRILPLAYYLYYKKSTPEEVYELTKNISSLTHRHEISILACYIYINFILFLLKGKDKYSAYNMIKMLDYSMFKKSNVKVFSRILNENIQKLKMSEIKSTGYVVDTLEASLWVTLNAKNYKEGIIGAINLGGDTDTIGAITGSMVGIIYGYDDIPEEWKKDLAKREYLEELSNNFENVLNNK